MKIDGALCTSGRYGQERIKETQQFPLDKAAAEVDFLAQKGRSL